MGGALPRRRDRDDGGPAGLADERMIPNKPVPDPIRDGRRRWDKIMRKQEYP
jgi:hypothetical protein